MITEHDIPFWSSLIIANIYSANHSFIIALIWVFYSIFIFYNKNKKQSKKRRTKGSSISANAERSKR